MTIIIKQLVALDTVASRGRRFDVHVGAARGGGAGATSWRMKPPLRPSLGAKLGQLIFVQVLDKPLQLVAG